MPDTGKMKRLFEKCTSSIMASTQMDYPEGDLDGVAEQLGLFIEECEERVSEAEKRAHINEKKFAQVMRDVRTAHSYLKRVVEPKDENKG